MNARDKVLSDILSQFARTIDQGSIVKHTINIGDGNLKGESQMVVRIPFSIESEGRIRDLRDELPKRRAIRCIGIAKKAGTKVLEGSAIGRHGVRDGRHFLQVV